VKLSASSRYTSGANTIPPPQSDGVRNLMPTVQDTDWFGPDQPQTGG
jgi:hypothetical protein